MVLYIVKYSTSYDYDEIVDYYQNKDDAEHRANQINRDNPGLDAYVDDIEAE